MQVSVRDVPRKRARWLPFARNQEYSEDVIDRAADTIVEGLQQRGHYLATVDFETEQQNNILTVTFDVNPGRQYRLTDVSFIGNQRVDEDRLHGIVATTPRGGFRRILQSLLRRRRASRRTDRDDATPSVFYRRNGFRKRRREQA